MKHSIFLAFLTLTVLTELSSQIIVGKPFYDSRYYEPEFILGGNQKSFDKAWDTSLARQLNIKSVALVKYEERYKDGEWQMHAYPDTLCTLFFDRNGRLLWHEKPGGTDCFDVSYKGYYGHGLTRYKYDDEGRILEEFSYGKSPPHVPDYFLAEKKEHAYHDHCTSRTTKTYDQFGKETSFDTVVWNKDNQKLFWKHIKTGELMRDESYEYWPHGKVKKSFTYSRFDKIYSIQEFDSATAVRTKLTTIDPAQPENEVTIDYQVFKSRSGNTDSILKFEIKNSVDTIARSCTITIEENDTYREMVWQESYGYSEGRKAKKFSSSDVRYDYDNLYREFCNYSHSIDTALDSVFYITHYYTRDYDIPDYNKSCVEQYVPEWDAWIMKEWPELDTATNTRHHYAIDQRLLKDSLKIKPWIHASTTHNEQDSMIFGQTFRPDGSHGWDHVKEYDDKGRLLLSGEYNVDKKGNYYGGRESRYLYDNDLLKESSYKRWNVQNGKKKYNKALTYKMDENGDTVAIAGAHNPDSVIEKRFENGQIIAFVVYNNSQPDKILKRTDYELDEAGERYIAYTTEFSPGFRKEVFAQLRKIFSLSYGRGELEEAFFSKYDRSVFRNTINKIRVETSENENSASYHKCFYSGKKSKPEVCYEITTYKDETTGEDIRKVYKFGDFVIREQQAIYDSTGMNLISLNNIHYYHYPNKKPVVVVGKSKSDIHDNGLIWRSKQIVDDAEGKPHKRLTTTKHFTFYD